MQVEVTKNPAREIYWVVTREIRSVDVEPTSSIMDHRSLSRPMWSLALTTADLLMGEQSLEIWASFEVDGTSRHHVVHALTATALVSGTVTISDLADEVPDASDVKVTRRNLSDIQLVDVTSSPMIQQAMTRVAGDIFAERRLRLVFAGGFVAELHETERDQQRGDAPVSRVLGRLAAL